MSRTYRRLSEVKRTRQEIESGELFSNYEDKSEAEKFYMIHGEKNIGSTSTKNGIKKDFTHKASRAASRDQLSHLRDCEDMEDSDFVHTLLSKKGTGY